MGHSLLSRNTILENLGKGVIIEPFRESQLKTCSYDVRLGRFYYKASGAKKGTCRVFNPYDPRTVRDYYGEHQEAVPAAEIGYREGAPEWVGIEAHYRVAIIEPGEIFLGHTDEYIGGTKDPETDRCFVAEMKARSSIGRIGIEVCRCAGWGDVGYVNRWTMEIVNTAPAPIILVVERLRIAQMKFYEVDPVDDADLYGASGERDHYQSGIDLLAVKKAWKPTMLLPRLSLDKEIPDELILA